MNTIEQSIRKLERWRKKDIEFREWELRAPTYTHHLTWVVRWEDSFMRNGTFHAEANYEEAKTPRAALDKLCRRLSL